PFGHIAMHVVQSPSVWLSRAHCMVFPAAVSQVPSVGAQLARIRPKTIGGLGAGPAGVFPLRLGGKPVEFTGLCCQPFAISHCRILGHIHRWKSTFPHAETHVHEGWRGARYAVN